MKIIKYPLLTLLLLVFTLNIHAQSEAVKRAAKSIFTLTTFNQDGSILASSHGVFVGKNGEAIGTWTPFVGAAKAVVVDIDGRQYDVDAIYGANELYDVCKYRVDCTSQPIPIAQKPSKGGEKVWLAEYAMKKARFKQFIIKDVENFMEKYAYYIFSDNAPENATSSAFINQNGELIGILQHSKNNTDVHATDARFINTFEPRGLTFNEAALRQSGIPVALPTELNNARLTLMVSAEKNDSLVYQKYINDFIRQFPTECDGYTAKARLYVDNNDFDAAAAEMEKAIQNVTNKDEAHSSYSTIIYQKQILKPNETYEPWSFEKALDEAQQAYAINPTPTYKHQVAQVKYSLGNYLEAYDTFMELSKSEIRNGELFYEAAQCQSQLKAPRETIMALLDSAVNVQPESSIAAPYYLARGRMYDQAGEYRLALGDYNKYDTLTYGRSTDDFYYLRFKCESKIRHYQQALNDIAHAILLNRGESLYYAEMASLQLRVNEPEDAIVTCDMCLQIEPDYPDPYIVKGIALNSLGRKDEAKAAFIKAKELGDERGEEMLKKYKLE